MRHVTRFIPLLLGAALGQACADRAPTGPASRHAATASGVTEEQPEWGPWSTPVNLGPVVNSPFNDQDAAISKDGLSLYISSDSPGGLGGIDLWVAHRESRDDAWGPPVNLGPNINSPANDLAPTFSPDGHQMYFHSFRPGDCGDVDIYVAHRIHTHDYLAWAPAENLGCVVNSPFRDILPTYFDDDVTGRTILYLASNRPGGLGGFDVYESVRGTDGSFGPATPVAELNSPFRDARTAIRRDGLEVILASERPGGLDPRDLWVATRATTLDPWGTPANLGPVINSTAFDGAPTLSLDGTELYFFSARPGGFGGTDLYVATRSRFEVPVALAAEAQSVSAAPLVQHVVAPQVTDPAIDRALDNHYAWLDTAAPSNHKLFVFMPGTGQRPALFQLVPQEAARLGYHVVGLMYSNTVRIGALCPAAPDPVACYGATRLEIIDGVDRSPLVDVSPTNSIDNRLTKLLEYLAAQYPDEGWSQFLADGAPKWPLIAVAGHSLGGGEAAMIGKIRLVARVVMFSAVNDTVNGGGSPLWVAPHVTPLERYYGIAHDRDPMGFGAIRASWEAIGLAAFGAPVAPETNAPPYDWSHMLVTDLAPQPGTNPHGAPSNDLNTPLAPDGTPLLRDAWRYLLGGLPRRPGLGEQVAEAGVAQRP